MHFKIICRRTEMTHQQRASRSGSAVIECVVGEWHFRPPLVFMLEENISSTCCNKHSVM